MMTMRERLDWCEKQGSKDLEEIIALFRLHESAIEDQILRVLWDAATGDTAKEPTQSPENVDTFYKRFPSIPILRPLMACGAPECKDTIRGVTPSYNHYFQHLAFVHHANAGQIADKLEELVN